MKMIYNNFDPITNVTTVTLADKYGTYIGIAKLHPDDINNSIAGFRIAEERARIKFYKARLKREKIRLQTLISFKKEYHQDFSLKEFNFLEIRINRSLRLIKDLNETISIHEDSLKEYFKTREKIVKKIKDKNK